MSDVTIRREDAEELRAYLLNIPWSDGTPTSRLYDVLKSALAAAPRPAEEADTLEALAEQMREAGWTIDDEGDDVVLRASRDFPEDLFRHRLYICDRNPLIPATVMFIEEGYEEDGREVYALGPTMTEETLDALILFRQFQKAAMAKGGQGA